MKVIARFPSLDPVAEATALPCPRSESTAEPPATASPRACRGRGGRPGFPVVSVGVLATIAVVVWTLASWNDSRRLERARQERIARAQAFESAAGTVAR